MRLGSRIRVPVMGPCSHARGRLAAFTTDPRKVTCLRCRTAVPDTDELYALDRSATEEAWLDCCRHLGAPSPTSDGDELVAQQLREQHAKRLRRVDNSIMPLLLRADERRDQLNRVIDELGSLASTLAPVVHRALVAFDVLEEGERLLSDARRELDATRAVLLHDVTCSRADAPPSSRRREKLGRKRGPSFQAVADEDRLTANGVVDSDRIRGEDEEDPCFS